MKKVKAKRRGGDTHKRDAKGRFASTDSRGGGLKKKVKARKKGGLASVLAGSAIAAGLGAAALRRANPKLSAKQVALGAALLGSGAAGTIRGAQAGKLGKAAQRLASRIVTSRAQRGAEARSRSDETHARDLAQYGMTAKQLRSYGVSEKAAKKYGRKARARRKKKS